DDQLVFIARRLRQNVAARIAEVALAVELADVPRRLAADAVVGADEVAVGDRVALLLDLPEILRVAGGGRRRLEHDLRARQPERARPLGEVAVVADVHADARVLGVEDRVTEIAR